MTPSWWRRAGDLTVTGAFTVLTVIGAIVGVRSGGEPVRAWGSATVELLSIAALTLRRRHPLAVLAVTTACGVVAAATTDRSVIGPLLPAIALYTLAAASSWRRTAVAAIAVVTVYGAEALAGQDLAGFTAATVIFAIAAAVGLYAGEHRRLLVRAETEQRLLAAQAVLAERVWIARELHDAIGHHVSLLVVQAGAVRTTLPDDHPAWPMLTAMIDGGREAMTEMRRLVDVLQPAGEDDSGFGPPPGLADLPGLCDRLRAGGLPVDVHIDVAAQPGRTAGITAYRIVQEALTNVIKHAGQVATRVDISGTADLLDLRVTNARPTTAPAEVSSGGRGLDGIRRRAALFGGEVFAGPVPGGGYALRATLRLRESA
jgi:signal transduction histidine kinase